MKKMKIAINIVLILTFIAYTAIIIYLLTAGMNSAQDAASNAADNASEQSAVGGAVAGVTVGIFAILAIIMGAAGVAIPAFITLIIIIRYNFLKTYPSIGLAIVAIIFSNPISGILMLIQRSKMINNNIVEDNPSNN